MTERVWKYEIGDRVIDYKEDGSLKRDLTIIDRKIETKKYNSKERGSRIVNVKYYKLHCNICEYEEQWTRESHLSIRKNGCSNCKIPVWKYDIGNRIVKKDENGKIILDLTITNRKVEIKKVNSKKDRRGYENRNVKIYEYTCNICGAEHLWKYECHLTRKGCPCCSGKIKIRGINTIGDLYPDCIKYFRDNDAFDPKLTLNDNYDAMCPICKTIKTVPISSLIQGYFFCENCHSIENQRPDLIKYLVNQEDAKLSCGSGKKILVKCPNCGSERTTIVKDLTRRGFRCTTCGDYISYPEKFMANVLTQLDVNFVRQLSSKNFAWCEKYRYDFYIKNKNMIIETHGIQHYKDVCGRSLVKNVQENDKNKEELAKQNNIDNYIVLDCRYSTPEWIKNSILNSALNEMYDLSIIDWNECAESALKSIVKEVCSYWNDNVTIKEISKILNIDKSTAYEYLKIGTSLDWCNYSAEKELSKQKKKVSVFKDGKYVNVFDSISDTAKKIENLYKIKISKASISNVCNGKCEHAKGFVFQFTDT